MSATSVNAQSKTTFSVETDPATFAFNGFAIHGRATPQGWEHWVFGAGIYSLEFPDLFVDMNPENKNEGWKVQLQRGFGLFTEYYFDERNQGWFVGSQIAMQKYRIMNSNIGSSHQDFTNLVLFPHAGYRWFPFNNGFYLKPWLGVGYTTKISGSNQLRKKSYYISPIIPFATLHTGYRF